MDNKLRITRYDTRNWAVERFVQGGINPVTRQPGPDRWEVAGYFGKLDDTADWLINYLVDLRDTESLSESLRELKASLAEAREEIRRIVAEELGVE